MKILLVDDSAVLIRYISALLAPQGHVVTGAGTLTEALESVLREPPEGILMDFILEPGRTGLEALAAIFALLESQGRKKPRAAIITAGPLTAVDEARVHKLGAIVIQKPQHGNEAPFLQAVENWVRI